MEENFEGPKKKKILPIIVILIILALLTGGVIGYKLITSSPKRIINGAINKAFEAIKTENDFKKQQLTTDLSVNVDTEDDEIKDFIDTYKINTAKVSLNTKTDLDNEYLEENISLKLDEGKILDATTSYQNGSMYLKADEFFSKSIELTSEYLEEQGLDAEYVDLAFETAKKISTKENNKLIDEMNNTVKEFLSDKEFTKEKTTLSLGEKDAKVTKNSVKLKEKEVTKLAAEMMKTLKANEYFLGLFGDYKDDIKEELQSAIEDLEEMAAETDSKNALELSVYTKGFFDKVVKLEAVLFLEDSEQCYSVAYTVNSNKESVLAILENTESAKTKDLKEIAKVNITKEDKTTTYELKIPEYKELKVKITWQEEKENKGKLAINLSIPTELMNYDYDDIKITLNCDYNVDYKSDVSKQNVKDSVEIENITEEDFNEIYENLQNSKLYEMIQEMSPDIGMFNDGSDTTVSTEPCIVYDDTKIYYVVPSGYTLSEIWSTDTFREYEDSNYSNLADISIQYDTVEDYLNDIDEEYEMTSEYYSNQSVSDTNSVTVGDLEFKYRVITYKDDFIDGLQYYKYYIAYQLDEYYIYTVEFTTTNGDISISDFQGFLELSTK